MAARAEMNAQHGRETPLSTWRFASEIQVAFILAIPCCYGWSGISSTILRFNSQHLSTEVNTSTALYFRQSQMA
jgi:hypothetical protein